MTNDMRFKILLVATEAVPFAKEGGVADVIGSLPKELAALGHEVCIFLPRYGTIDPTRWALKPTGVVRTLPLAGFNQTISIYQTALPDSPVTVYLLEHEWYFGRHQHIYLGLPDDPDVPVVGIVSRLVDQKGFDLIAEISAALRELPLQLVVLGTGHPRYEQVFRELSKNTGNVRARIGFDVALSHRIYAGADFFLMPSAFEPGGLGQLIALGYGT